MQRTANLAVAVRARQVAIEVYRLTATFPPEERYGMSTQMRRSAVSIGSNIAEGCGRKGDRALVAFLQVAMGSASELEFQLELAVDLNLTTEEKVSIPLEELRQTKRMLGRLISVLRHKLTPRPSSALLKD